MISLNEETKNFIRAHRFDDVRDLALRVNPKSKNMGPSLRAVRNEPAKQSKKMLDCFGQALAMTRQSLVDWKEALIQIEGRQLIKDKLPLWYDTDDMLFPAKISLEQTSSEITANYKASLVSGKSFVDLTGGYGVDFAFISAKFEKSVYVEKQERLVEIAAHNFGVLNLKNVETIHSDSVDYLQTMEPVDLIFIDPARRSASGRKVACIEDCEPDISSLQTILLEKADRILIKLSPMLDITQALRILKNVREVHVVSVENECKELLFLIEPGFEKEPCVFCANLSKRKENSVNSFYYSDERMSEIPSASTLKKYLYEPNASILKAGYFKGLSSKYGIEKLHPDSHLYTSDTLNKKFPGRILEVNEYSSFNKKELSSFLNGIEKMNITVRNFPLSADELRKKWKVKDGGDIYVFATTLPGSKHILIKATKI